MLAAAAGGAVAWPRSDDRAQALQVQVSQLQSQPGSALFNSAEGRPFIDGAAMRPGEERVGNVTIRNTAPAPQEVQLVQQGLTRVGSLPADPFTLSVVDASTGRTLYQGRLSGMESVAVCGTQVRAGRPCPPWSSREEHRLVFTLRMADVGNEFAGRGWKVSYLWVASNAGRPS